MPLFTSCREGGFSETGFPQIRASRKLRLAVCNARRPSYHLSIRCAICFRRPIWSSNRRSCFLIRCRRSSIRRRGRRRCFCLAAGGIRRQPTQKPLPLREEAPSSSWGLSSLPLLTRLPRRVISRNSLGCRENMYLMESNQTIPSFQAPSQTAACGG